MRVVAGASTTIPYDRSGDGIMGYAYSDDDSTFYADYFDTQLRGSLDLTMDGENNDISFTFPELRTGESLSGSYTGKMERMTPPE